MSEIGSASTELHGKVTWPSQAAGASPVRPTRGVTSTGGSQHERLRAVGCLANLLDVGLRPGAGLEERLAQVVRVVSRAWPSPEPCGVRLVVDDRRHESAGFRPSGIRHAAEVVVGSERRGAMEVFFMRPINHAAGDLSGDEHQSLLGAVATRVGWLVERCEAEATCRTTIRQLQADCAALQQSNEATKSLLQRATTEKQATQEAIVANVEKVLLPALETLKQGLPADQQRQISLMKNRLEEIVSPSADKLSRAFMSLTAVEIEICEMIRDGLTTKAIARRRRVSPATVARQRERIRHKLGLIGSDANLATYLRTFFTERAKGTAARTESEPRP